MLSWSARLGRTRPALAPNHIPWWLDDAERRFAARDIVIRNLKKEGMLGLKGMRSLFGAFLADANGVPKKFVRPLDAQSEFMNACYATQRLGAAATVPSR